MRRLILMSCSPSQPRSSKDSLGVENWTGAAEGLPSKGAKICDCELPWGKVGSSWISHTFVF